MRSVIERGQTYREPKGGAGRGEGLEIRRLMKSAVMVLAGLLLFISPVSSAENIGTFSIVAFDPETGDLGVGVQSRYFAVGSVVPHAQAGVGAIATQAKGNITYGPAGLKMLEQHLPPEEVLKRLVEADKERDYRQVGIVDATGRAATYTGSECLPWAGGHTGANYAVQGNILAGPEVLDAMAASFETGQGDLASRIMAALRAAQAAGGDVRGRQSAMLLIVRKKGGYTGANDRFIELHVEDHPAPIRELRRLLRIRRGQMAALEADRLLSKLRSASQPVRDPLVAAALKAAELAVGYNENDDWAWLLLARARLASGAVKSAARAARNAILINPALKKIGPKPRAVLGLSEELLQRLVEVESFRRLWNSLPGGPSNRR